MKKSAVRWLAVAAIFGGALASSPNSPVSADTFYPLPAAPAVTITDRTTTGITPGSTVISVTATVGLDATIDDLSTITLCLYKESGVTSIPAGSSSCAAATPEEPSNMALVTWTENTNTVELTLPTVTNTWGLKAVGSGGDNTQVTSRANVTGEDSFGTLTKTHQALQITFRLTASGTMLAGNDWKAVVTATYPNDVCVRGTFTALCSTYSPAPTLFGSATETLGTVAFAASIVTGAGQPTGDNTRANLEYGFLLPGGTSPDRTSADNVITYKANDATELTVRGTNFSATPTDTLTLVAVAPSTSASAKEVAIQCRDGGTAETARPLYDATVAPTGSQFQYVPNTISPAAAEDLDISRNATSESADDAKLICKLTYGAGAKTALVEYSNTVTVGVKPIG